MLLRAMDVALGEVYSGVFSVRSFLLLPHGDMT